MRVLYLDGVGPFGGASRSLYEAIKHLPAGEVEAYFIATKGTALNYYKKVAKDIIVTRGLSRFDNTAYGHYRGLRWLIVLRELFHLPFTIISVARAKRKLGHVDLVHVNEITEIIPLLIAKYILQAPAIVHVRSVQRTGDSKRTRWIQNRLRRNVDAVVAIDESVRASLPPDMHVDVVHNSFSVHQEPRVATPVSKTLDSLPRSSLKVGFVGNLLQAKGIIDLIEAARIVIGSGRSVEFVIVGGNTRRKGAFAFALSLLGLAQDSEAQVKELVRRYGLQERIHLLGPTDDIQSVYERLDILCFPSYLYAPGRPVFEAAFFAVPSVVAVAEPRPDTLIDGHTGVAIPEKSPDKLATAIMHFADDREEIVRMGTNAKELALSNFEPTANSVRLLALYRRVLSQRRQGLKPTHREVQAEARTPI